MRHGVGRRRRKVESRLKVLPLEDLLFKEDLLESLRSRVVEVTELAV